MILFYFKKIYFVLSLFKLLLFFPFCLENAETSNLENDATEEQKEEVAGDEAEEQDNE